MQLLFAHPLLSTSSAHLVSLGLGSVYVGSIFVARKARLALATNDGTVKGTRDDPEIIKSRLVSVSMATLGCCAGVFGILWKQVGGTIRVSPYYLCMVVSPSMLRVKCLPSGLNAWMMVSITTLAVVPSKSI